MAFLTGIGFTMSLFIGTLAFPSEGNDVDVRVPVLAAFIVSAGIRYTVLRIASRQKTSASPPSDGVDAAA
jgi:Na+:H+ antiporter, NhaA family